MKQTGLLIAFSLCSVGTLWGQSLKLKLASASNQYELVQKRLSQGWNTWDVNSVITQVLLPEGLAGIEPPKPMKLFSHML
jgi:hypothetical protein